MVKTIDEQLKEIAKKLKKEIRFDLENLEEMEIRFRDGFKVSLTIYQKSNDFIWILIRIKLIWPQLRL